MQSEIELLITEVVKRIHLQESQGESIQLSLTVICRES